MLDFKNGRKEGGKKARSNTTVWKRTKSEEEDKIRGTLFKLQWSTAAPGQKPLRLPRARLPEHPRVNKAIPT